MKIPNSFITFIRVHMPILCLALSATVLHCPHSIIGTDALSSAYSYDKNPAYLAAMSSPVCISPSNRGTRFAPSKI